MDRENSMFFFFYILDLLARIWLTEPEILVSSRVEQIFTESCLAWARKYSGSNRFEPIHDSNK